MAENVPVWLQLLTHTVTFVAAIGISVFFFRLYGSLGARLRDFVKWIMVGIAMLSLSHLFGDITIWLSVEDGLEFWIEHAIDFAGLALIAVGAWKLYNYSEALRV